MSWNPIQELAITVAAYNPDPDVVIPFEPQELNFANTSTDVGDEIYVSFDGKADHIKLVRSTPWQTFRAITKQKKVWFRRGLFAGGTASVAMTANSYT